MQSTKATPVDPAHVLDNLKNACIVDEGRSNVVASARQKPGLQLGDAVRWGRRSQIDKIEISFLPVITRINVLYIVRPEGTSIVCTYIVRFFILHKPSTECEGRHVRIGLATWCPCVPRDNSILEHTGEEPSHVDNMLTDNMAFRDYWYVAVVRLALS